MPFWWCGSKLLLDFYYHVWCLCVHCLVLCCFTRPCGLPGVSDCEVVSFLFEICNRDCVRRCVRKRQAFL